MYNRNIKPWKHSDNRKKWILITGLCLHQHMIADIFLLRMMERCLYQKLSDELIIKLKLHPNEVLEDIP